MTAPALAAMILVLSAGGWTFNAEPPAGPIRIEHADDDGVVDLWMECGKDKGRIAVGALIPDLEASAAASVAKLTSAGMASVSPATLTPNQTQGGWTMSTSVSADSPVLAGVPETGKLGIEVEGTEKDFRLKRTERPLFAQFLAACAAS